MKFRRLEDAKLKGKTAIVRVDFNLPRDKDGKITDDTRLQSALPTIKALREGGAKVVLLSHFGRPNGEVVADMSLSFVVEPLVEALECTVAFSDAITPVLIDSMDAGEVLLLENTRFDKGEEAGDAELAKRYAELGDIFVMDAFSVAHRRHATSAVIADYIPAYAGLAMEREIDHISQALDHPKAPVMAVVGGAKVSTKIDLLSNLVKRLDILAITGGMANTFLYAGGHGVGKSLHEPDYKQTALDIMATAKAENCQIILPIDGVAATEFKANAEHRVVGLDNVKDNEMILDAGPETVEALLDAMDRAKTLIWNGPLGAFEMTPFDTSTVEAAKYAAKRVKENGLIAVAGGGDTVAALNQAGVADDFTFISTAGGAFLEWMEGKALPGVEILKKS
ncbi:phosphoglycerate kinase [Fretibacter rubidus]|uniref:phosphoglycerate kinase n=1 Tax=Fretibacter rubidus TaxID=570162 RepID=UPI00352B8EE7